MLNRVKIKTSAKTNIYEYDYYDVQDGETPEMIAFKYYGRPDYHWTILLQMILLTIMKNDNECTKI